MRAQYPFFRDGDEQTQAVIGEEAVNADLDGEYQKPYAVLTQKRLYCKSERGNFITDASALQSAGKTLLPGQNWFLWAVVACVSLVLALLCFWYWGDGKHYARDINHDAQEYIDDYHALEERAKEDEQRLDEYEAAQEKLEEYEKTWSDNGYEEIAQEISKRQAKVDSAQQKLEKATQRVSDTQARILDCEKQTINNQNSIKSKQEKRQEVVVEWSDTYREYARHFEGNARVYQWEVADLESKLNRLGSQRDQLSKEISDMQSENQSLQTKIADLQAKLPDYRDNVKEARKEVADSQEELAEYTEKNAEIEAVRKNIAEQKDIQASIDCETLESEIQQFKDSKSDYQNAQSIQRKVMLFMPCLLAFAACVVALAVLTGLRRTKPAVMVALASACVGLVCASSFNINPESIRGFWWFGYIMEPRLSITLQALLVLAVPLAVLALWWNRKKTVYQIVHNTGAFYFTPSVYPAKELRLFTEQVQLMREGGADGE